MKISILCGTPRARQHSVSHAYIDFLVNHYSDHEIAVFPISRTIRKLESKGDRFDALVKGIAEADIILWQIPVYSAAAPAQVVSFVELIFSDKSLKRGFKGKYTASISTSLNLFDNCVHEYLQAVSEDLDMVYTGNFPGTFSALRITPAYRRKLIGFVDALIWYRTKGTPVSRLYPKSRATPPIDWSVVAKPRVATTSTSGKTITVVTDCADEESNLWQMISQFKARCGAEVRIFNLAQTDFDGCRSCLRCTENMTCSINDNFQPLHDAYIRDANGLIIAGDIRYRYLSAKLKTFFDRCFFNNHLPYLKGRPLGLIISGELSHNAPLKESLQSILEVRGGSILGIVSDESADAQQIADTLGGLAERFVRTMISDSAPPVGFHSVSATTVLRDFVYIARFPLIADFEYFRKNHFATFPQRRLKLLVQAVAMTALSKIQSHEKVLRKWKKMRNAGLRKAFDLEPFDS